MRRAADRLSGTALAGGRLHVGRRRWRLWADRLRPLLRPCLTGAKYLAPLVLLAGMALGAGYVRLLFGPISLEVLADPIARSIAAELPGYGVTVENALVRLDERGQLEFRLKNVRVLDEEGNSLALAPLAALEPSRAALWSGRLSPAKVVLIEPRLLLSYSAAGGFSFSFARPETAEPAAPGGAGAGAGDLEQKPEAGEASRLPTGLRQIDIARLIAESAARARSGADATSYLREVGIRDATLVLEQGTRRTLWSIPHADLSLRHQRSRSAMLGTALVASERGPWTFEFRAQESERTRQVVIRASVRDLVPRTIATALPGLAPLRTLDLPASGDAYLELTSAGRLTGGHVALDLARGEVLLPWLGDLPLAVESGRLELKYEPGESAVRIAPSTLVWGRSRITVAGTVASSLAGGGEQFAFDLASTEGSLAAEEFGVAPLPLEKWTARGVFSPETGAVEITEYSVRAGGGEVRLAGRITTGEATGAMDIGGRIGAMSLPAFKALWPRAVAPGARQWVGRHIEAGRIAGGTFRVQGPLAGAVSGRGAAAQPRVSMALEANDLQIRAWTALPPIELPASRLVVDGSSLEASAAEGSLTMPQGRRIALKSGSFTATDIMADVPRGQITFQVQGAAPAVLEVIEHEVLGIGKLLSTPDDTVDGKVEGQVTVALPLVSRIDPDQVKVEARARLTDGRARQLLGAYDAQAATLVFDVTDKSMDARGDLLIAGVPARLSWQRIFDAPPEKQPPMRLTATLDGADRTQLGLDSSSVVHGEVPVELIVTRDADDAEHVHVSADLTRADVVLENIAWRKPPGRTAFLQFDVVQGARHKTELHNFKVVGDDIAIDGWVGLDAQNRMKEFSFPDFSISLVTRLEIQGTLRGDNVWAIKARGQTYDGREFFRSLFSVGELGDRSAAPRKDQSGLDLEAEIDTVLGFSEVSLRGVALQLSKRGRKLTRLEAKGTLDGGKLLEVELQPSSAREPRRLVAVTEDAGQAFRLVDFYPSLQGGRMRLDVNLDGRGPAEKTGLLWVERFRLLGDPVVSEVLQFPDSSGTVPEAPRVRRVVRQAVDFDWMRVPFSVGYGQFVMGDSELRGGLLGATIRGKADFRARTINLAGTYVPLQGLNSALGVIPGLGQLLAGPKGEGVLGITFAIQGPMDRPQVLVNPLSLVAPGIFREMFQLTNPSQSVTPPRIEAPRPTPPAGAKAGSAGRGEPEVYTGWSSETTMPEPTKKK